MASAGAHWIAAGILELLGEDLPDAVGGMAIGADPITAAVITLAAVQQKSLRGFIVRKESKQHGTGQQVEGPVEPGDRVVIVEDVVTTGATIATLSRLIHQVAPHTEIVVWALAVTPNKADQALLLPGRQILNRREA